MTSDLEYDDRWHCDTPGCPETFLPDDGYHCADCEVWVCQTCKEELHDHTGKFGRPQEYDPTDPRI